MRRVTFVLDMDSEHTYAAALAVLSGRFNIQTAVGMSIAELADHGFVASKYSSKIDVYNGRKGIVGKSKCVRSASAKERILHWKKFVYKQDSWHCYFV